MNAHLLYNQKTAHWVLFDVAKNKVVKKDYSKGELVKWATANGYSNIERK